MTSQLLGRQNPPSQFFGGVWRVPHHPAERSTNPAVGAPAREFSTNQMLSGSANNLRKQLSRNLPEPTFTVDSPRESPPRKSCCRALASPKSRPYFWKLGRLRKHRLSFVVGFKQTSFGVPSEPWARSAQNVTIFWGGLRATIHFYGGGQVLATQLKDPH